MTKREVKMAGYWPSSFFATKERGQYPAIVTATTLLNRGLIIWLSGKFLLQDSAVSPPRLANHSAGIGSSCPFTELAI